MVTTATDRIKNYSRKGRSPNRRWWSDRTPLLYSHHDMATSLDDPYVCSLTYIAPDGAVNSIFMPTFVDNEVENGEDESNYYVIGNNQDHLQNFYPVITRNDILDHAAIVYPKKHAPPPFNTKDQIPGEYLEGTVWDGADEMVAFPIPCSFFLPYDHVSSFGNISSPSTLADFGSVHKSFYDWGELMAYVSDNRVDTGLVVNRIFAAKLQTTLIAPDIETDTFLGQYAPYTMVNPINPERVIAGSDLERKLALIRDVFHAPTATATSTQISTITDERSNLHPRSIATGIAPLTNDALPPAPAQRTDPQVRPLHNSTPNTTAGTGRGPVMLPGSPPPQLGPGGPTSTNRRSHLSSLSRAPSTDRRQPTSRPPNQLDRLPPAQIRTTQARRPPSPDSSDDSDGRYNNRRLRGNAIHGDADTHSTSSAPSQAGMVTFAQLQQLLVDPEKIHKLKEVETGAIRVRLLLLTGDVSFESEGSLDDWDLPTLTSAYREIVSVKSIGAQTSELQSYLQSHMESDMSDDFETLTNLTLSERSFEVISRPACLAFLKGDFSRSPSDCVGNDASAFDLRILLPQHNCSDKIEAIKNKERIDTNEVDLNFPDSQKSVKKCTTSKPGSLTSVEDVMGLLANILCFFPLVAIDNRDQPIIFLECMKHIYKLLLDQRTKKWRKVHNQSQPNFHLTVYDTIESCFNYLAEAAGHHKYITLAKTGRIQTMVPHKYRGAIMIVATFVREVRVKVATRQPYPDRINFSATPAVQPHPTPEPPTQEYKQTGRGRPARGNVTNGSRHSGAGFAVNTNGTRPSRDPLLLGFFVPGSGCSARVMFGFLRPSENEKSPCFNHHGIGTKCDFGRTCRHLHGSARDFSPELLHAVLEGMCNHKTAKLNHALKNTRWGSTIPVRFSSLWDQPAGEASTSG